jgi:hypothetical protein
MKRFILNEELGLQYCYKISSTGPMFTKIKKTPLRTEWKL